MTETITVIRNLMISSIAICGNRSSFYSVEFTDRYPPPAILDSDRQDRRGVFDAKRVNNIISSDPKAAFQF